MVINMDKVIKECLHYKANEMQFSSSVSIQNIINNKKRKKLSWVYISSPIIALTLIFIFIFIPSDKQFNEVGVISETNLMEADLTTSEPIMRNNKSAASDTEMQPYVAVMKMQDEIIINNSLYILLPDTINIQIKDMLGKIQTNDAQQSANLNFANILPLGTEIFYTSDESILMIMLDNKQQLYYQKQ